MPLQIDQIAFEFQDNHRFHNDLVLRIGKEEWRCDSYYLLLDGGDPPENEAAAKVRRVLKRLLEQWRHAVSSLPDGSICFLPYDFSDQCTAWVKCQARGPALLIQRGWSMIEGWSFSPSEIGDLFFRVQDFRADGKLFEITRTDFLRSLESSQS